MQRDNQLYRRLFSEVFLYLRQHPQVQRWRAVMVYPSPAIEVVEPETFGTLLATPEVQVVYLNELAAISELSLDLGTLRLMVEPAATVPEAARGLIEQVQQAPLAATDSAKLLELIETIVVYTFPRRTREDIAAMLGLTDMRETRVYQEGREEEAKSLILRLLNRKLGELPEDLQAQVSQLPLATLEAVGEALFDFGEMADLQAWLAQQHIADE